MKLTFMALNRQKLLKTYYEIDISDPYPDPDPDPDPETIKNLLFGVFSCAGSVFACAGSVSPESS
jgi:hypothetical protein